MLDIFSNLGKALRVHQRTIDGTVFRLHYRLTCLLLLIFAILVTSTQYFGNPIECALGQKDAVPTEVINTYCWVTATYSSPSKFDKIVGKEVAHPGVGLKDHDDDVRYYKYYQWVWIVLFLQAMLFYLPHYLWKCMENKTIENITLSLNLPIDDDKKVASNRKLLADYVGTMRDHSWYAYKYFFCEFLNFLNVIGQMFFVNRFLDGEFTTYGPRVIEFMESEQDERIDPMVFVFPRVTKCLFHKFGSTGEIERHAALCVLPLNIVNEKIYVFMWFWFVMLAIFSGLLIIYRFLLCCIPRLRTFVLHQANKLTDENVIEDVLQNKNVGLWLVLSFLGENIDSDNFKEVLQMVSKGKKQINGQHQPLYSTVNHCSTPGESKA